MAPDVRLSVGERFGAALLVTLAGWITLRVFLVEGSPAMAAAYLVLPISLSAGYALGRFWLPRLALRELELVIGALVGLLVLGAVVASGPAIGPLGYANANAALGVQLAGLAGLLSVRFGARWSAVVLGLVALASALPNRSIGGVITGVLVSPALLAATAGRPRRRVAWLAWTGGLVVVVTGAAVVWLARTADWPPAALAVLGRQRQIMWSDAWRIWSQDPLLGQGPGSFARLSQLGSDADTAMAHSWLLQAGAETGLVGVLILTAIVAAGLVVAVGARGPAAAIAIACWTALWTHSLGDHVLDFPAVGVLAGAALGWAAAGQPGASEQFDVAHRKHP